MYVSDSDKNEDYWAKRVKNNVAARRSREARRLKENQVNLIDGKTSVLTVFT
jgi:leukemia factor-related protein